MLKGALASIPRRQESSPLSLSIILQSVAAGTDKLSLEESPRLSMPMVVINCVALTIHAESAATRKLRRR